MHFKLFQHNIKKYLQICSAESNVFKPWTNVKGKGLASKLHHKTILLEKNPYISGRVKSKHPRASKGKSKGKSKNAKLFLFFGKGNTSLAVEMTDIKFVLS